MEQKLIGTGLAALVVGFALGYVVAPNKGDLGSQIERALSPTSDTISSGVSGLAEQISALGDRLDSVESSIASTAESAADTSGLDELRARIESLSGEIGSSLSKTQTDISSRIDELGDMIGTAPAPAAAGSDSQPAAQDSAAAPAASETVAAENAGPPQGLTVGQSAVFADGSVRAFVSMVGDSGARLSINGDMAMMASGESTNVGDCLLTVDAIDRGHVQISGVCGAEVPAAQGFGPGEVALFDDGATRVFVSGVSDEDGTARVAINGFTTQTIATGDSAPVGGDSDCSVVLEGIDRGHAQFGYACGS